MRHAYLIIAHNDWQQLKRLLQFLDSENSDIYVHIDRKAKEFDLEVLNGACTMSSLNIFSEYKNYWGSYRLVKTELFLLEKAIDKGYDYYHLLSGADLPIKPIESIDKFFEENAGKEFVHFDTDSRLQEDKEIARRTRLYHWLQNYRKRFKSKWLNSLFTFIEHCSLGIQLVLGINRLSKIDFQIYYGSQWFSITHGFAKYVLGNKSLIEKIFTNTSCSDELVFQTLIMSSPYRNNLYIKERENTCLSNMRLIDWQRGRNGSPYTWSENDYDELINSECLFARKFNSDFPTELINKVIGR